MSDRNDVIADFLAAQGIAGCEVRPLAGDASNRRYLRLVSPAGRHLVLMDAPPERGENVRPFVAVTDWLRARGLSAPEIVGLDTDRGLILLEDLGDDLFARVAERRPDRETELYQAAVDLLIRMPEFEVPHRLGRAGASVTPAPYDSAALRAESRLLVEWYLPAATGAPVEAALAAAFDELIAQAVKNVADAREVVVLRDYHAENLIWLPERRAEARVGLLDYQDALAGHPAYDLVSLLEDARRDTGTTLREAMVARYLAGRGLAGEDAEAFRAAYAALGAQRNLKIVGIFARLALRDGKPRYLQLIPRVWTHLMNDLADPDLAALRAWVTRHVPAPTPDVLSRVAGASAGTPGGAG